MSKFKFPVTKAFLIEELARLESAQQRGVAMMKKERLSPMPCQGTRDALFHELIENTRNGHAVEERLEQKKLPYINNYIFAVPKGFEYDTKALVKSVKSLSWAKMHKVHLEEYASRLTLALPRDEPSIIESMLYAAFGGHSGLQVKEELSNTDIGKISNNIIRAVYYK